MKPFNRYIITYFSDVFNKLTTVTMYAQSENTAYSIAEWLGMKRIHVDKDIFRYASISCRLHFNQN